MLGMTSSFLWSPQRHARVVSRFRSARRTPLRRKRHAWTTRTQERHIDAGTARCGRCLGDAGAFDRADAQADSVDGDMRRLGARP
jgi:hypothetical protein